MTQLKIAPIVEGHGEYESIRLLLQRIWVELLGGEYLPVIRRPIRVSRSKIVLRPEELRRAIELAAKKLTAETDETMRTMILLLLDADRDPPCLLAPDLLRQAAEARPDLDVACVLANVEYETWFVAAADSLGQFLEVRETDLERLDRAEEERLGKGWIQRHFRRPKYSETLDQPSMTTKMDLTLCRRRSPSFDKLCRELEARREA